MSPQLDPPEFALRGGLYIGTQTVEIDDGGQDGQIVYTLDRSEPSSANGLPYDGPVLVEGLVTVKAAVVRASYSDSDVVEQTYRTVAQRVESEEPISLSGDDVLEIADTHFIHRGPITLSGNSKLILRDSVITHDKDFAFQYELRASENAQVIVENSGVGTTCTGSFNWAFFDDASLIADRMDPMHAGCNTWNFMSGSSNIDVTGWNTFSGTVCDQSNVAIRNSRDMEIEFCFPAGIRVDTELPTDIDHFTFSGDHDNSVEFALEIDDSTIDGWGINVLPGSDITIRNTPAITVGVIVGRPWVERTVEISGLAARLWEDEAWEIGDARLRLVNTYTYGWEPNVFSDNTLVIRNSDYSGSAINSGTAHYIIENSRIGQLVANENVTMEVRNSVVLGDVIANGNSIITLIDSQVGEEGTKGSGSGSVFARDNGRVVLERTVVLGERMVEGDGVVTAR